jgi:hypothetical protein
MKPGAGIRSRKPRPQLYLRRPRTTRRGVLTALRGHRAYTVSMDAPNGFRDRYTFAAFNKAHTPRYLVLWNLVGQMASKTKLEVLSGKSFDKSYIKGMVTNESRPSLPVMRSPHGVLTSCGRGPREPMLNLKGSNWGLGVSALTDVVLMMAPPS